MSEFIYKSNMCPSQFSLWLARQWDVAPYDPIIRHVGYKLAEMLIQDGSYDDIEDKGEMYELMTESRWCDRLTDILNTGIADGKDYLNIKIGFNMGRKIDQFSMYSPNPYGGNAFYYFCGKKFYITSDSTITDDSIEIL